MDSAIRLSASSAHFLTMRAVRVVSVGHWRPQTHDKGGAKFYGTEGTPTQKRKKVNGFGPLFFEEE